MSPNHQRESLLHDYCERVARTWRGECPPSYAAGGWPWTAYPAVQTRVAMHERPYANDRYGPDVYARTGEQLPNTVLVPMPRDSRTGRPMKDDPRDLGGASISVGSARCVYLSLIEPVIPDDVVCDDDALGTTPESTPQLAAPEPSPSYTPEQCAFARRLLDAFALGKTRDRYRALNRILRDIAAGEDWVFNIRALLYVMRNQPGFAAWRRERDEGIRRRGRKPKSVAKTVARGK